MAVRLGLALSEQQIGLALIRQFSDGRSIIESSQVPELARDGNRLLEQIDRFLASCNSSVSEIGGIAICAGPGGFTRVRVACAIAQGIGLARDIPVAPVNSMQAEAVSAWRVQQHTDCPDRSESRDKQVCVLLDARMKQVYAATYQISAHGSIPQVTVLREPGLLALDAMPAYFKDMPDGGHEAAAGRCICGDGAARYLPLNSEAQRLAQAWLGTPGALAYQAGASELAVAALCIAQPSDWVKASQVAPFYLRQKVALNIKEQAALRAANRQAQSPQSPQ